MSIDSSNKQKSATKRPAAHPKGRGSDQRNEAENENGVPGTKDQKPNGESGETKERKRGKPDDDFERKVPHTSDPYAAQGYVKEDVVKKENSDLNKARKRRSGQNKKGLDDESDQ